ncbi:MAG: ABC transporter ATP-binding protein [Actinobacteria bacterium]|nr:ABC transporter ATP-binding protein [Actinomycetota bacterium]
MSTNAQALVEVEGLHVDYGDVAAVRGVDLLVRRGEIVVLLGANGAGKTSTLESIEGYRSPSSGTVRVLGTDARSATSSGRVGVQLQDDGMAPGARVGEVVGLFRRLHGSTGPTTAELLKLMGLSQLSRKTVRKLSGGEHRRLAVAIALVGQPELLLFDEPTAGVDAGGRASIVDLLLHKRGAGVGVLMTTHEMAVATELADRIVIMHHGIVVGQGTIAQLLTPEVGQIRFRATPSPNVEALAAHLGTEVSADADFTVVQAKRTNELLARLLGWCTTNGIEVGDIDDGAISLDDVVTKLTQETYKP